MSDNRITVRLTSFERETIELLVREGKYVSITSFVRQAINAMLRVEGKQPHE